MRFRTVVSTAPITLFIEDGNHRITFLEGNGFAGIDIVSTDPIGKPTSEAFAALPQIHENTQRASSTGEDITEIITFQDHYYEFFAVPLKAGTDSMAGVIGIVIDVTKQKSAQNELERYRAELEKNKVLATIGALSTEITAEIAKPLQGSKLALLRAHSGLRNTIGAGEVRADIQEALNKISQAVMTLDGFCEKANLEKLSQPEPIHLYELVRRVLAVTKESAENAMVRVVPIGVNLFPVMRISGRELEQVLYNMVQKVINSADRVHVCNLEINFAIQDKCLCMKFSETRQRSSRESVNETVSHGTEIRMPQSEYDFGLSVLKGIVEANKGTIMVTRNSEDSTVYEIQFPLAG
jgi:signal transduction histidine kinase